MAFGVLSSGDTNRHMYICSSRYRCPVLCSCHLPNLPIRRRKKYQHDDRLLREQNDRARALGTNEHELPGGGVAVGGRKRKYHHLNVLCTGMKRRGGAYSKGQVYTKFRHSFGSCNTTLELTAPVATLPTSSFESPSWRLLLSRIGTFVSMSHVHTYIYVCVSDISSEMP